MTEGTGEVCDETRSDQEPRSAESSIELSTPWGASTCTNRKIFKSILPEQAVPDQGTEFVEQRTRIHEVYIREDAKTKRIALFLSFLLLLSAAATMLFAPEGRETLSYWIGAALVVFAAGAVGFRRVWGKAASISFGADQDQRELDA